MGLTVQYKSRIPDGWSWDYAIKQLEALRQFATTLPIIDAGEVHQYEGESCNWDKSTEEDERWRLIHAKRGVQSPWMPGSYGQHLPNRSAMIDVHVADGCEPFIFGVSNFDDHVWEPNELECNDSNQPPYMPYWSMILDNKSRSKESYAIIKKFMDRFKLRKTRRKNWTYKSGHQSDTPCWESVPWLTVKTTDQWQRSLVEVGEARTKYISHRQGWDKNVAAITFIDPRRCGHFGDKHSLVLEFNCSVEEAYDIVNSRAFKMNLKALVTGKRHVTPGGRMWSGFCKTHYAVHSEYGGINNFIKAHLSVCSMLEKASELGFIVEVDDEGSFWDTHDLDILAKEINQQNAMVAAFAGAFKDAFDNTDYGIQAEAFNTSDFERNEMLGSQSEKTAAFLAKIADMGRDLTKQES